MFIRSFVQFIKNIKSRHIYFLEILTKFVSLFKNHFEKTKSLRKNLIALFIMYTNGDHFYEHIIIAHHEYERKVWIF